MTLVVDASVAALWVLNQEHSADALAVKSEAPLIAPSLIAAELGSAIWKAVRRGDVSKDNGLIAIRDALLPFEALVPMEDLRTRAFELAVELDHPIYDCFYLALAERERAPLITADRRLLAAARRAKGIAVKALGAA
jgi:predicted nucleic acid-binding protein